MSLKRIILTSAAVMMLLVWTVKAQSLKSYGFKIALTSAYQKLDNIGFYAETKRRVGFNAGISAEWTLKNAPFAVLSQLEYCQRGMSAAIMYSDPPYSDTGPFFYKWSYFRLDYLSLPVLGKFSLEVAPINPYLLIGPRLDFLVGRRLDLGYENVYNNLHTVVFGGSVGIGLESNSIFTNNIIIEARYNFDLSNSYRTYSSTVFNNAFDIWLGVSI